MLRIANKLKLRRKYLRFYTSTRKELSSKKLNTTIGTY
ncbi:hypothetical protein PMIN01_11457 [Paraphaeosphaeria minitans]|uniref:Uncharacterized protein n=1 Tax=Paraphaeosphaeria minitans TaxID=565426 RepID=A0A9P6G8R4_9PLEO|nr:hypothetical protein PMIN01_11457 [Paraphaeosphaeria minitans]